MVHHVYPTTFPPLSEHPEYIAKYLVVGIHIWDFPHHAQVIVNIFAMHGQKLSRQRSHSFDEDQDGEWWPPPLTEEDVAIRQRAKRLLQAIRQIPLVYYDIKAWENEHENVFSLFRQGCLDGAKSKILEAALYNNQQIEDAWLFLLEMRRRHRNRRRHVQECVHVLGASYNWSMVLEGSRKILEALNDLPQEICTEILEDANAHDLLRSIYPNQRRPRRQMIGSPVPVVRLRTAGVIPILGELGRTPHQVRLGQSNVLPRIPSNLQMHPTSPAQSLLSGQPNGRTHNDLKAALMFSLKGAFLQSRKIPIPFARRLRSRVATPSTHTPQECQGGDVCLLVPNVSKCWDLLKVPAGHECWPPQFETDRYTLAALDQKMDDIYIFIYLYMGHDWRAF